MTLSPEHWPRIKDLFDRARTRAPELRGTFLDETCAGNDVLRREVESLLASSEQAESLRGLTPPLRKSLDIAAQLADGLSAAHTAGVTHRDLRPDNVMVTRDGRVKLIDFSVATARLPSDADAAIRSERDGTVTRTIGYMAPEQVRATDVDSRADIFSFGAVLFELLTGTRAFSGDTAADVITAILKADPPELPPAVPAAVREIVHRCLEKRREERFQSARDLAFALRQAAAVTVSLRQRTPILPARYRRRQSEGSLQSCCRALSLQTPSDCPRS